MGAVHVRRLDDQVIERLKLRAAVNDRSLEGEVRHILEQAVEDDMAVKLAAFRELSTMMRRETGGAPQTPSHVLIGEDRESGHRDA